MAASAVSTLPSSTLSVSSSSSRVGSKPVSFRMRSTTSTKSMRRNCSDDTLTATVSSGQALPSMQARRSTQFAEIDDQAAVLGDGDEFARRNLAAHRMRPAAKRLDADDLLAALVDDRLVEQAAAGRSRSRRAGRLRAACGSRDRHPSPRRRCRRDCGLRSWRGRAPCRRSA